MTERRRNRKFELTQTGEFLRRSFDQDPRLGTVLHIANKLSAQISQIELLELIMEALSDLLGAERSTLFLVSGDGEHLWSEVAEGEERVEIRIKVGEGIAGWVAKTGRAVNVKDAYQDPRFDRRWDDKSGFVTTSVLCQPLRNREGDIIGVAQAINKAGGAYFSIDDEIMMRTIMALASISVVNGDLYRSLLARNLELREAKLELQERVREIDLLYAIEREVAQEDTLESAINTLLVMLMTALPCASVELVLKADDGAYICHSYSRAHDQVTLTRIDRPHGLFQRALNSVAMVDLDELPLKDKHATPS